MRLLPFGAPLTCGATRCAAPAPHRRPLAAPAPCLARPQHHRPSTFMPCDVHIERDEAIGAATVWCSEHEPMGRMKGMHGVCLRPGSALVELRVRLFNRTPLTQTFLWWANVGVHVNEHYQRCAARRPASQTPGCSRHPAAAGPPAAQPPAPRRPRLPAASSRQTCSTWQTTPSARCPGSPPAPTPITASTTGLRAAAGGGPVASAPGAAG